MWRWLRLLGGVALLAIVVYEVGAGPFRQGIAAVSPAALLIATGIGVVTTCCSAWRWRTIAAGVGVDLPMRTAVASCYRSQFLNSTLPGGVVGDVHRAYRHGVRPVVLERLAGLAAQLLVALVALSVLVPATRPYAPLAAAGLAIAVLLASFRAKAWILVSVAASSAVVLASYVFLYVVAARLSGTATPLTTLVPLALAALMAMLVPVQVAGWGPRELASAWAFSTAGLTSAEGVAVAATYGVLSLVATLPGAAVLLTGLRTSIALRHRGGAASGPGNPLQD